MIRYLFKKGLTQVLTIFLSWVMITIGEGIK